MREINIFFFSWLGGAIQPIYMILPGQPLAASLEALVIARTALGNFEKGGDLEAAFPRAAAMANELMTVINEIVPPVGAPIEKVNLESPIERWQIDRLKALSSGLAVTLRDEAQRSYILKVEDQRCLSSHTLVEKVEECFAKDVWATIGLDAKREFEECGKCLALERYTGAGFHSLRAVECVIRQYLKKLTGTLPMKRDWGFYIEILRQNGVAADVTSVLDNIRTLERNPLMHPEHWLDVDDAIGIFNISHTAISRLAVGIRKAETRP